jgi:hypothetical protein
LVLGNAYPSEIASNTHNHSDLEPDCVKTARQSLQRFYGGSIMTMGLSVVEKMPHEIEPQSVSGLYRHGAAPSPFGRVHRLGAIQRGRDEVEEQEAQGYRT